MDLESILGKPCYRFLVRLENLASAPGMNIHMEYSTWRLARRLGGRLHGAYGFTFIMHYDIYTL